MVPRCPPVPGPTVAGVWPLVQQFRPTSASPWRRAALPQYTTLPAEWAQDQMNQPGKRLELAHSSSLNDAAEPRIAGRPSADSSQVLAAS